MFIKVELLPLDNFNTKYGNTMINLNVNNLIFVFHQTENTPEKAKK